MTRAAPKLTHGGRRPGAGRPPGAKTIRDKPPKILRGNSTKTFVPTPDQVRLVDALVGYGIPQRAIVDLIINPHTGNPINKETLEHAFSEQIATGQTKATAKVAEFLFQKASGQRGDDSAAVTAAIFWMKTRASWKDRDTAHHDALAYLAGIYRDNNLPPDVRLDAAKAAVGYEKPRLASSTIEVRRPTDMSDDELAAAAADAETTAAALEGLRDGMPSGAVPTRH